MPKMYVKVGSLHFPTLTTHNWQNWKRVFQSYYCHETYSVEEVVLKTSNYTLKITFFVNL